MMEQAIPCELTWTTPKMVPYRNHGRGSLHPNERKNQTINELSINNFLERERERERERKRIRTSGIEVVLVVSEVTSVNEEKLANRKLSKRRNLIWKTWKKNFLQMKLNSLFFHSLIFTWNKNRTFSTCSPSSSFSPHDHFHLIFKSPLFPSLHFGIPFKQWTLSFSFFIAPYSRVLSLLSTSITLYVPYSFILCLPRKVIIKREVLGEERKRN